MKLKLSHMNAYETESKQMCPYIICCNFVRF